MSNETATNWHTKLANKAREIWDEEETRFICHCLEWAADWLEVRVPGKTFENEFANLTLFVSKFIAPAKTVEEYLYPDAAKSHIYTLDQQIAIERFRTDHLWPAVIGAAHLLDEMAAKQPTTPKEI